MKNRIITLILTLLVTVLGFSSTLVIKGSNTVFPIAQVWIEHLSALKPELKITLEGAGSSTGISALFSGTCDIANSSRWLKAGEIEKMAAEKKYFMPVIVGYDGIALIVGKQLGIDSISIESLKAIYTGKAKTWNQIDPNLPKQAIVAYSRNTASGTFEIFSEKVLGGEKMSPEVRLIESTQLEMESVSRNPYAIAYVGIGYVTENVKVLTVEGVLPSRETILSSAYPISRPLYLFIDATKGFPGSGPVRDYLLFALSRTGQELLEEAGYVAAYGF